MDYESFYSAIRAYTVDKIKSVLKKWTKSHSAINRFFEREGYYVKEYYHRDGITYAVLITDVDADEIKGAYVDFAATVVAEISDCDVRCEYPDIVILSVDFYKTPDTLYNADELYDDWLHGRSSCTAFFDESITYEKFCEINNIVVRIATKTHIDIKIPFIIFNIFKILT